MSIKSELEALQKTHPILAPETVIKWAQKNQTSALHRSLEWNDSKAGHQYRLWQVRQLISIHVKNEIGIRQFVSLKIDRQRVGGGYRHMDEVMSKPKLRQALLDEALAELDRVQQKYESLKELAQVWNAVERVRTKRQAA